MQIQAKIPAFDDFSYVLAQADTPTSPSELHGVLSGLICVEHWLNGGSWLDIILKRIGSHTRLDSKHQEMVLGLYDIICRQLGGLEDEFQLLLPNENQPIAERAKALSNWCQGFLYGLALGGDPIDEESPDMVHEALRCISEIAQLDFDQIEVTEMDGIAYEGVIEFITNSVPIIYSSLTGCLEEDMQDASSSYLH